jgi:hypothetical protein
MLSCHQAELAETGQIPISSPRERMWAKSAQIADQVESLTALRDFLVQGGLQKILSCTVQSRSSAFSVQYVSAPVQLSQVFVGS